jgi:hypothetical protein
MNWSGVMTKEQAAELALDIAEKWWKERKLSYNWQGTKDVAFLAKAIYDGKMPETDDV